MKRRAGWRYYAERGITVEPDWLDPHMGFLAFMRDMGPALDGAGLRRLDPSKSYTRDNTFWEKGGHYFNARNNPAAV